MRTILVTNKYDGIPLRIVKEETPQGFSLIFLDEQSQEEFSKKISLADYILAGGRTKISKEALMKARNLKMIQRSGVGLDSLDLEAIKANKIPLYVNQGINSESVAEHTLLLMLASLRRLTTISNNTKQRIWKKQEQGVLTSELKGKTIGIIGMGCIAQRLVDLLEPFSVSILYYNLYKMPVDFEEKHNMKFVSLIELLRYSDVVTIHCSLTEETNNLINSETISMMKDGAILINTARGEIVNANDISEALREGKLSFAALDVHEKEPIPNDYPLLEVENVILTPHIAGVTYDSFRNIIHEAFKNIECFERGELEKIESSRYL